MCPACKGAASGTSAPLPSGWSMPVAAPCCDQPGARFEDHAVFGAVVRGEHFSEALNGTVGLVHYLTNPLRAAARSAGDTESFHLWAGQNLWPRSPGSGGRDRSATHHGCRQGAATRPRTAQAPTVSRHRKRPLRAGTWEASDCVRRPRKWTAIRSDAPLTPDHCKHHSTQGCRTGAGSTHAARLSQWT